MSSQESTSLTENDENSYKFIFKIILIGDSGTGKTSLINRYIKNEFDPDSPSTIAGSFISKTFKFPEYDNILQMEVNTIHNTK